MELAPAALEDPAWDAMAAPLRERAEETLRAIVDEFGGVVVGVGPLVRHLVAGETLGHRSTLEAVAALVAHDLLRERPADDRPVLWVPDRLVRAAKPPLARRRPPRRNLAGTNGAAPEPAAARSAP